MEIAEELARAALIVGMIAPATYISSLGIKARKPGVWLLSRLLGLCLLVGGVVFTSYCAPQFMILPLLAFGAISLALYTKRAALDRWMDAPPPAPGILLTYTGESDDDRISG